MSILILDPENHIAACSDANRRQFNSILGIVRQTWGERRAFSGQQVPGTCDLGKDDHTKQRKLQENNRSRNTSGLLEICMKSISIVFSSISSIP